MQKSVPPCPICGKDLVHEEQEVTEEQFYQCWTSEGGCGAQIDKLLPVGRVPNKIVCPNCGKVAKLGVRPGSFSIVHGKSMTKGASLDVAIGRNAEERWGQIHERQAVRNKVRQETGTQALTAIGKNEYKPLKEGKLTAVTVPDSKVNPGEKF